jgi:hypothetical protein
VGPLHHSVGRLPDSRLTTSRTPHHVHSLLNLCIASSIQSQVKWAFPISDLKSTV